MKAVVFHHLGDIRLDDVPDPEIEQPLWELVKSGQAAPATVLTQEKPFADVIETYRQFDRREPCWVQVNLQPRYRQSQRVA